MARVAIFTNKPQAWVSFDEDTEVLIEYLTRPAAIELNNRVDAITERTAQPRQLVWGQQLGEAAVKGWRHKDQVKNPDHPGFLLPDNRPLEFNDANRDLMMEHCREFSLFVNEKAVDGKFFIELQQRDAAKGEQKND